jgi:hypothetical protein
MGKKGELYRLLVEKPGGKTLLGRPICRWVDKIRLAVVDM